MNTLRSVSIATALAFAVPLAALAQTPAAPTPAEASFKRADANGDGKLSKTEAAIIPAIASKFDELDRDKDGALSLAEYSVAFSAAPSK